jgi:uncharacterized membrane protein YqiK
MLVVFIEIAVSLVLIAGVLWWLQRVREDHDELIVEHWRRNGRDRQPWGW